MNKARIEIVSETGLLQAGKATPFPQVAAQIVKIKPGAVNWKDKLKAYYHTLIAVVGFLLLVLNEVQPWLTLAPPLKLAVTIIIGVLTIVSILLKANERWVNSA